MPIDPAPAYLSEIVNQPIKYNYSSHAAGVTKNAPDTGLPCPAEDHMLYSQAEPRSFPFEDSLAPEVQHAEFSGYWNQSGYTIHPHSKYQPSTLPPPNRPYPVYGAPMRETTDIKWLQEKHQHAPEDYGIATYVDAPLMPKQKYPLPGIHPPTQTQSRSIQPSKNTDTATTSISPTQPTYEPSTSSASSTLTDPSVSAREKYIISTWLATYNSPYIDPIPIPPRFDNPTAEPEWVSAEALNSRQTAHELVIDALYGAAEGPLFSSHHHVFQ